MLHNIDIVIPLAGVGRRMRASGPRSFLDLGGETVIQRQIRLLRNRFRGASVYLIVDENERPKRKPRSSTIIVTEGGTYQAGAVATALSYSVAKQVLVVDGSLVFEKGGMPPLPKTSCVFTRDPSESEASPSSELGVNLVNGQVLRIDYGLPTPLIKAFVLSEREKEGFLSLSSTRRGSRKFVWEVLNEVLDAGGILTQVIPESNFIAIETQKDFKLAKLLTAQESMVN